MSLQFPWRSLLALVMLDVVTLILLDDYPLAQIMVGFVSVVVVLIIPIPYAFRRLAKLGCIRMGSMGECAVMYEALGILFPQIS